MKPVQPITSTSSAPSTSSVVPNPNAIALAKAAAAAAMASAATANPSVELPSYYNPAAINVAKYANQIQKRKLLWGNKNPQENAEKWQQTAQFSKDEDGKVASKFMRLMGIKNTAAATSEGSEGSAAESSEQSQSRKPNEFAKKQSEMLSKMEQQYEVARAATHTMRGMGLGFSRPY